MQAASSARRIRTGIARVRATTSAVSYDSLGAVLGSAFTTALSCSGLGTCWQAGTSGLYPVTSLFGEALDVVVLAFALSTPGNQPVDFSLIPGGLVSSHRSGSL